MMNLPQRSYIRTHKQSVVHLGELTKEIVDYIKCFIEKFLRLNVMIELPVRICYDFSHRQGG